MQQTKSSVILCTGQYTGWRRAAWFQKLGFDVQNVDVFVDQSRVQKPRWRDWNEARTRKWGFSILKALNAQLVAAAFEGALARGDYFHSEKFYVVGYGAGSDCALSFLEDGRSREQISGAILFYPHLEKGRSGFHRISSRINIQLLFGEADNIGTIRRAEAIVNNFKQVTFHRFSGNYGFANAFIRGNLFPIPNLSFSPVGAKEAHEHARQVLLKWSSAE